MSEGEGLIFQSHTEERRRIDGTTIASNFSHCEANADIKAEIKERRGGINEDFFVVALVSDIDKFHAYQLCLN